MSRDYPCSHCGEDVRNHPNGGCDVYEQGESVGWNNSLSPTSEPTHGTDAGEGETVILGGQPVKVKVTGTAQLVPARPPSTDPSGVVERLEGDIADLTTEGASSLMLQGSVAEEMRQNLRDALTHIQHLEAENERLKAGDGGGSWEDPGIPPGMGSKIDDAMTEPSLYELADIIQDLRAQRNALMDGMREIVAESEFLESDDPGMAKFFRAIAQRHIEPTE